LLNEEEIVGRGESDVYISKKIVYNNISRKILIFGG